MKAAFSSATKISSGRAAAWLFIFIVLVYSSSLNAGWHLDDYANILQDASLHIKQLTPDSIARLITSASPLGSGFIHSRPLPRLSFALNWYLCGPDVTGYHWVNVGIHFFTALILFGTMINLFNYSPPLKKRFADHRHFIALLATLLWAVNPVQTQAVTYIVQRMASMAGLFYILILFAYVKGRSTADRRWRWTWWAVSLLALALAVMTKENTILAPLGVALVEVVFFQDLSRPVIRKRCLWVVGFIGTALFAVSILLALGGNLNNILKGYDARFFTLSERLLTQPRVLWFYLSLLFYPTPSRLNIAHDFTVSTGLLQPWTTLPAIIGLIGLTLAGLLLIRKRPLVSFAILFFFLNHVVESSIIPLEMVYEHRNYIPSMFIFVPVAAGYRYVLDYFYSHRKMLYRLLVVFGIGILTTWGMGTYVRNTVWKTEETLWRDAVAKSPHARRPLHNLAWAHYEANGQLHVALALYKKAAGLRIHSRVGRALSINNMANIHYRQGNYTRAAELWQEALVHAPNDPNYLYRCGVAFFKDGKLAKAIAYADRLLKLRTNRGNALMLKGRALLWQSRPREALTCFYEVLRGHPDSKEAAVNLGICLMAMKHNFQAEILFTFARGKALTDPGPVLWLARLSKLTGNRKAFAYWIRKLADGFPVNQIKGAVRSNPEIALIESGKHNGVDKQILQRLIDSNVPNGIPAE